jgi:Flp pilus assembly protein TadD
VIAGLQIRHECSATNLGVLEANQGRAAEAIKPWQAAFERAPGRSEIGMSLARLFCQTEQFDVARDSVLSVLRFNPDLGPAKKPPRCSP